MARPTKLKPETTARLVEAIERGATYELACHYAGIGYNTFRDWMRQAEDAPRKNQFTEFSEAIKGAEAEAAMKWLRTIDSHAAQDWKAAAWKLERRYPESYGRTVNDTRHSGNPNEPTAIKVEAVDYRTAIAALAPGSVSDSDASGEGEGPLNGPTMGQDRARR